MFYQTSKSHIPADRVAATRRITMADYVTSWHEHEEFMFLLPSQGTLTLTSECSKHSQRIGAGVLAMVPAGIFHDTASNPGEHCHTAVYAERDFVSFCARKSNVRIAGGDAPRYCVPPPALLGALRLQTQFDAVDETEEAHDMARYQNDLVDRLIASACVAAVLGAAPSGANPKVSRGQLVSEIKAYLDVMLAEPDRYRDHRLGIRHIATSSHPDLPRGDRRKPHRLSAPATGHARAFALERSRHDRAVGGPERRDRIAVLPGKAIYQVRSACAPRSEGIPCSMQLTPLHFRLLSPPLNWNHSAGKSWRTRPLAISLLPAVGRGGSRR